MAHSYHKLQHFDHWLSEHFLGNKLFSAEQKIFSSMLTHHFGKHALLIGVPHQAALLKAAKLSCNSLITPWPHRDKKAHYIEANFYELPIFSGSIDLVMLPHTLEFVDNQRQLLSEACRIVKPEGLIIICGFNPLGSWGLKKKLSKKSFNWAGNFIYPNKIKAWLKLSDFLLEQQQSIMYRPPMKHLSVFQKFAFLERLGSKFFPF